MASMNDTPAVRRCCVCQRAEDHSLNELKVELRPYGPGGADICHECAFATPEQRAQTKANFAALIDANGAVSPVGVAMIGQDSGPVPFDPDAMPKDAEYRELS